MNATSTPKGLRVVLPRNQSQETSPELRKSNTDDELRRLDDSVDEVTQRDLDQLKDTLLAKIFEQNATIQKLTREVGDLRTILMEIHDTQNQNQPKKKDRKLPPALSTHVHLAYDGLGMDVNWKFAETYKSKHNKEIKMQVFESLKTSKVEYEEGLMFKAIYRYFENLKRQEKEGVETKTTKRRTTRRHRLFLARDKVIKEGEDAELWQYASANVMSDEETDDEGPAKKRVFRRPEWRNDEFNSLVDRIDSAILEDQRNYGDPSTRKVQIARLPKPLVR